MLALIEAAKDRKYPAMIKRVISNQPDAGALAMAAKHGIATLVVDHKAFASRQAHEDGLAKALADDMPDIICLAGYMRILSPAFVQLFAGKMLNIHPSLLPAFTGTNTHARALAAGVKLHGASVHFVTERLDEGPIVAQACVPVLAGDNENTLAVRVLAAENLLYPHALALVAGKAAGNSQGTFAGPLIWPAVAP